MNLSDHLRQSVEAYRTAGGPGALPTTQPGAMTWQPTISGDQHLMLTPLTYQDGYRHGCEWARTHGSAASIPHAGTSLARHWLWTPDAVRGFRDGFYACGGQQGQQGRSSQQAPAQRPQQGSHSLQWSHLGSPLAAVVGRGI